MEHPAINTAWLAAWDSSLHTNETGAMLHPTLTVVKCDQDKHLLQTFEDGILVWEAAAPYGIANSFIDALAKIQLLMRSKSFELSIIPWFWHEKKTVTKYEKRSVIFESGCIYLAANGNYVAKADLTEHSHQTQEYAYLLTLAIFE